MAIGILAAGKMIYFMVLELIFSTESIQYLEILFMETSKETNRIQNMKKVH